MHEHKYMMYSISRTPTRTLEREIQSLLEGPEAGDDFSEHCHLFPSFPLFFENNICDREK